MITMLYNKMLVLMYEYRELTKGDFMTLMIDMGYPCTKVQGIYQYHVAERGVLVRMFIHYALTHKWYRPDNWPVSIFPKHTNISTWWFYTSRKFLYKALFWLNKHTPWVHVEDDDRNQVTTYSLLWWQASDIFDF